VQKTTDAISTELRLLPHLEEVTRRTSLLLPNRKAGYLQVVENMVDLVGIEPTTSSMPWKRAPSCATGPRLKTIKPKPDESGSREVLQSFSPTLPG
jgi:hypothetical protein